MNAADKTLTDEGLAQLSALGVLAVRELDVRNEVRDQLPKRAQRHIDDGFYTTVKGYRKIARMICPDYSPLRLRTGEFLTDCQSGFERKDGYDISSGPGPTAFRHECQRCELYTRLMEARGTVPAVQPPKKEVKSVSQGKYRDQRPRHQEGSYPLKWALTPEENQFLREVMEKSMTTEQKLAQFDQMSDREKMRDYPGHSLGSVVAKWFRPLGCDRDLLYYYVKNVLDDTRKALVAGSTNTVRQELYNQTVVWIGKASVMIRGFHHKPLFEEVEEQPVEAPKVVSMPAPAVVPEAAQTEPEAEQAGDQLETVA